VNVVDSSAWLEFFSDGPNGEQFAAPLGEPSTLIVPTIVLYEVFKIVLRERGEDSALQAAALLQQGTLAPLSSEIAMNAAALSLELALPMADAIILATARNNGAVLWTQDEHFKELPDVKYFPRNPGSAGAPLPPRTK
jgi:toxin FitB